ncbi:MAG: UvrD-helicase domain-containing protein [Caldisericaceae bacterium]|nr:UvrD-helicase domain-containing protein [Caldisericaceae bacterium]
MEDFLKDLNEQQKQAVLATEGPVLIIAGAGSGKTRTLTYRIAYLINKQIAKPSEILAVTFTNKAAREMKERLQTLLGNQVIPLWMGTFHSVCARILRIEAEKIGLSRNFTIYDVDDSVRALRKILSSKGLSPQKFNPKVVQNRISRLKNQFILPENLLEQEFEDEYDEVVAEVYKAYQAFLKQNHALDFDDLLIRPIQVFDEYPEIKTKYNNKFRYILVDEYQDTNHAQYLLLKRLLNPQKNLCVVGDEDQSIYGWRGADIQNILNFNRDFPQAKVFKLEENYRSHSNILKAANAVVKNNKSRLGKNLWTKKADGPKIRLVIAEDEVDEARKVVEIIHDEMYTYKRSFKDIAILYRTNAQSRALEDQLRRNAISYNIIGGVKFYDRKEIKDVLAYLKVLVNPADSVSLRRIINFPLRGIGETTVNKIERFAEIEHITLFDALGRVDEVANISATMGNRVKQFHEMMVKFMALKDELNAVELASTLVSEAGIMHHYQTEYDQYESESRIENIKELFTTMDQFAHERQKENRESDLAAFLEEVSLLTDIDTWNESSNAVTLMTLHSAKGLEFPVVCITGLEMGLMPLQRSSADLEELEEERRLFYVGMTRAMESLYLTYANRRRRYNSGTFNTPSVFLDEIPGELIEYRSKKRGSRSTGAVKKRRTAREKKLEAYFHNNDDNQDRGDEFFVGQKVYHETFGKGQILQLEGSGEKMKITVHFFRDDITKKLIKKFANLSPLEE